MDGEGRNPFREPGGASPEAGDPGASGTPSAAGADQQPSADQQPGADQEPGSGASYYTSPSGDPGVHSLPADVYERILPGRGGPVFLLAVGGLALSLIGMIGTTLMNGFGWTPMGWVGMLPFSVSGAGISMPTFLMALGDLRAMRMGAMQLHDQRMTRVSLVLALLGALCSGGYLLFVLIVHLYSWTGTL